MTQETFLAFLARCQSKGMTFFVDAEAQPQVVINANVFWGFYQPQLPMLLDIYCKTHMLDMRAGRIAVSGRYKADVHRAAAGHTGRLICSYTSEDVIEASLKAILRYAEMLAAGEITDLPNDNGVINETK